jgi:putative tryptophan/tyrosine transport system substrate-binding protein
MVGITQGDSTTRVSRCAMHNPATAPYFEQFLSPFKTAAASLGVEVIASPVHDRSDLELAIAALTRVPNGGLGMRWRLRFSA